MSDPINKTAQQRFDETYITSTELQRRLRVTRSAVMYARQRGILPEPIVVNDGQLTMWERAAINEPMVQWIKELNARRDFDV